MAADLATVAFHSLSAEARICASVWVCGCECVCPVNCMQICTPGLYAGVRCGCECECGCEYLCECSCFCCCVCALSVCHCASSWLLLDFDLDIGVGVTGTATPTATHGRSVLNTFPICCCFDLHYVREVHIFWNLQGSQG